MQCNAVLHCVPMSNNWVCARCGRGFSRSYSARRHIRTVEGGHSALVSKAQYEFGIRTGALIPQFRQRPFRKNVQTFNDLCEQKLKENLAAEFAQKALKNPECRNLAITMFMNEVTRDQAQSDKSNDISTLLSKLMN